MGKLMTLAFVVVLLAIGIAWYSTREGPAAGGVAPVSNASPGAGGEEDKPGLLKGIAGDVSDVITGEPQFAALDRAKTSVTKADLRTYQTAITMFYTQNNRFPKDLQELQKTNMIDAQATLDPWGQPFRSEIRGNKFVILSSGKSKISHTDDDIWAEIPLE